MRKYLGQGALSVLDIGCGNGDFLKFLQKTDPNLTLFGVDMAPNQHPGITFYQQDFFDFKCSQQFDVVVNLTVIEHVENVDGFVAKAKNLVRKGGLLITTTNNNNSLLYRVARLINRMGLKAAYNRIYSSHHVNHFSNQSLRILLERNGLKILSMRNHNYPLAAIDTPPASAFVKKVHKFAVVVIFALSFLVGKGFLQTYICKRED